MSTHDFNVGDRVGYYNINLMEYTGTVTRVLDVEDPQRQGDILVQWDARIQRWTGHRGSVLEWSGNLHPLRE